MPRKKKEESTVVETEAKNEVVNAEDMDNSTSVDQQNADVIEDNIPSSDTDTPSTNETDFVSRGKMLADKRKQQKLRAEHNAERESTLSSWEQLRNAKHENRVLTGNIIAIETLNNTINVAVVLFGGFRIIIPFEEMYSENAIDLKTVRSKDELIRRELQILQKLLGAEIPFIITDMTGSPRNKTEGYAIVASRKLAIQGIAARNFNQNKATGVSRIQKDDIVESTIISAGAHAVFVNIAGVDKSIPIFMLTQRYVTDCRDLYHPGDKINIYIKDIIYDDDGNMVDINVSGKMAEIPEFAQKMQNITNGMRCMGIITSIRPSKTDRNRTVTRLFLEAFDVPAIAFYTQIDAVVKPLQTGDRVIFSIYNKLEDRGYVTGNIIQRI